MASGDIESISPLDLSSVDASGPSHGPKSAVSDAASVQSDGDMGKNVATLAESSSDVATSRSRSSRGRPEGRGAARDLPEDPGYPEPASPQRAEATGAGDSTPTYDDQFEAEQKVRAQGS